MNSPLFSIVIPTKNRPFLLKDTIKSILFQNFENYELIVSDNSTNDETEQLVSNFLNCKQLKYLHPRVEMNMPTHFEWATKQALGKYVLLFTDRSVLIQGALRKLSDLIKNYKDIQVIIYPWLMFDEKRGIFCGSKLPKIKTVFRMSSEIIPSFLKEPENLYNMPRDLNSCYSAEIAKKIRNKFGALFMPINPDFTFSFLILSQVDKVLYINTPLFISQGLTMSTSNTFNSYLKSLEVSDPFYHVPLKIPLFMNTVFEDFLRIQELADKNLSSFNINWVVYFNACYRELLYKRQSFNKEEFYKLLEEFNKALEKFDKKVQNEVKQEMIREKIPARIKFWIHSHKFGEYIIGIKRRIDFIKIKGLRKCYKNILEAASFKSYTKKENKNSKYLCLRNHF